MELAGHAPLTGDLLRALRLRRRMTLEQIAASLGVTPRSVRRWEQSEAILPEERLDALCRLLRATPEERVALGQRQLTLWVPGQDLSLDTLDAQLQGVSAALHQGERTLMDLQFLGIEARLWQQARRNLQARRLLARAYALHAEALEMWGQIGEIKSYSVRALDLLTETDMSDRGTLYKALRGQGASTIFAVHGRPHERAIAEYRRWLAFSDDMSWRTNLYRDMAGWASDAGQTDTALEWAALAVAEAERGGLLEERRLAQQIQRYILLMARRYPEALAFLPTEEQDDPYQHYFEVMQCVYLFLGLGERAEASNWLNRAYAFCREFDRTTEAVDEAARLF